MRSGCSGRSRGSSVGHELIDRLAADGSDEAALALLAALNRDEVSVADLRPLLQSPDPAVAKAATWVASELGDRAAPLLDLVPGLLAHELRYVRFFALDVVLVAGDAQLVARGIELCGDPDEAVRWKAMLFLSRLSAGQLGAAVPYLRDEQMRVLTSWLVSPSDVAARLSDPDSLTRRFAVVAAVRTRSFLDEATASADTEFATFARDHLG